MYRLLLVAALMILIVSVGHATEEMVIDDCEYASAEAAAERWFPPEAEWAVSLMDHDGGKAVRLDVDFTGDARRAALDLRADLDLSQWGRFSLDIYIDDPRMFGSFSIYMQSGEGWYRASGTLPNKGWNTLSFPRSAFGIEDTPGGWDSIQTIRISPWKGAPVTGFFAVDNLMAYREDIAVVIGSYAQGGGEGKAVQGSAQIMSDLLDGAGIKSSTIGDEDVEAGALKDYKLAIFAYNPKMSEGEIAKVREFVEAGGKIMSYYSLPEGMAEIYGIKSVSYVREEWKGQFALMKFDAPEVEGLPAEVRQHTWNLTNVEPADEGTKIIAWWYDDQDRETGYPVFAMSDAGLFMTHVMTRDDGGTKQQLLLALLGHYFPELWREAAATAFEPPDVLGHFSDYEAGRAWVEAQAVDAPRGQEALARLADYDRLNAAARAAADDERYPEAIELGAQAKAKLGEAYLLGLTPREGEFRAVWEHAGTGPMPTWDESMKVLADAGFNAVIPNVLWGGGASYNSEYLPHTEVFETIGDQLAQCVAAGKKYGVQVHPWKVNWRVDSRTPAWFQEQMREEGRLQVDFDGNEQLWLCPSDPRNRELELNTMVEMARKYDVDGVHFDYIRYGGSQVCFCDGCRERFQRDTGVGIENWPADTRSDDIKDKWVQWRCDQISWLVQHTAEEVRAIKPDCKISAAVFSNYPSCRVGNGQDWVHWCAQGWLDFVCPMDYRGSDTSFANVVGGQRGLIPANVPFYPGIGASSSRSSLDAGRVAGQIQIARGLGADGFTIFNYGRSLADTVIPGVGLSLTTGPTHAPHDSPRYEFEVGEITRDITAGHHVQPGERVTVSVKRGEDIPGRVFRDVMAQIVLQDELGRTVEALLEDASLLKLDTEVSFDAREGLQRVAVIGGYMDGEGVEHRFTSRSLPVIGGELGGVIADVF